MLGWEDHPWATNQVTKSLCTTGITIMQWKTSYRRPLLRLQNWNSRWCRKSHADDQILNSHRDDQSHYYVFHMFILFILIYLEVCFRALAIHTKNSGLDSFICRATSKFSLQGCTHFTTNTRMNHFVFKSEAKQTQVGDVRGKNYTIYIRSDIPEMACGKLLFY